MYRYDECQAKDIAKRLFSTDFTQVELGQNNWVFEKKDRILTIPKHERVKDYSIRVNATKLLGSAGIPVPEVLDYSPALNDSPEYLIVRKVEGYHPDLSKCTPLERDSIHFSSGEVLRAIHQLDIIGYGRLKKDMIGEDFCWVDFIDKFFEESIGRVRKTSSLYESFGKTLEEEYSKNRLLFEGFNDASFLHADFHKGNLLFKDKKVSAVLDLDIVSSGDPSWDIGHYCHTFNIERESGSKSFRNGYNSDFNLDLERAYCLIIWTRKIGSQAIQRPEALKETIPELRKILRRGI